MGRHDASSDVWMYRAEILEAFGDDYTPIRCEAASAGGLSCAATGAVPIEHWLGCGLQLEMSSEPGRVEGGRNCTGIGVLVVGIDG